MPVCGDALAHDIPAHEFTETQVKSSSQRKHATATQIATDRPLGPSCSVRVFSISPLLSASGFRIDVSARF